MRAPRQITEPELEGLKRASGTAVEAAGGVVALAEQRIAKSAGPLLAPLSFSHRDDDLFAGAA